MINNFYVVDLEDTNEILGVQCLGTLGTISQNYQTMEMGFGAVDGKGLVLRVMSNGTPRMVSSKWMEYLFRNGDVAYATECLIMTHKYSYNSQHLHVDIQSLLRNMIGYLEQFLQGALLTRSLGTPLSWKKGENQ